MNRQASIPPPLAAMLASILATVGAAWPTPQQAGLAEARRLVQRGELPAAEALLLELVAADETSAAAWYLLGMARHGQQKLDEALSAHVKAASFPAVRSAASYNAACVHALKQETDAAFDWLERAVAAGFADRGLLATDTDLASLRGDPRFATLLPPIPRGSAAFAERPHVLYGLEGEGAGHEYGWVTRTLGDLDGDGATDFASTAPSFPGPRERRGKVYVHSGRTGELIFTREGTPGERLGTSVSAAGDVDGDGTPDVLAGAPAFAPKPGKAYVFSGRNGETLLELSAGEPGDEFGLKLCDLGDLNGDGRADVCVGAPRTDSSGRDAGRVIGYSGRDGSPLFSIDGERAGDRFGSALDATLDTDRPLLAIGAMKAGARQTGHCAVLRIVDGVPRPFFDIRADATAANLGQYFVTAIGDVDGDGTGDVYASDWNNSAGGPSTGRVFVHSGRTGELVLELTGTRPGEGFGTSVSDAGDVDGDGHADLIVGAWQNAERAPSAGRCTLHSGRDGRLLATYTSVVAGDTLGFDATSLGDVDGDGRVDLLLSSAWSTVKGPKTGRIFVVAAPDSR